MRVQAEDDRVEEDEHQRQHVEPPRVRERRDPLHLRRQQPRPAATDPLRRRLPACLLAAAAGGGGKEAGGEAAAEGIGGCWAWLLTAKVEWVATLTHSRWFDMLSLVLILFNTIILCLYSHDMAYDLEQGLEYVQD